MTRLAERTLLLVVGAFFAAAALVALAVPYHHTDGLLFGRWSRLVADSGTLSVDAVGPAELQRPLFYVLQGGMWHVFGFSEWSGRVLSLLFAGLLAGMLFVLCRRVLGTTRAGLIAVVVLVACPDFARDAFAGQTDVPAAALLAACGVVLWTLPPSGRRAALLVVCAAGAALAKPSALPAIAGLGLAALVGPRAETLRRFAWGTVPLGIGGVLAIVYEYAAASATDMTIGELLGGTGPDPDERQLAAAVDFFGAVNAQVRSSVILGGEWLGPYLVVPLLFALAYVPLRALGVRQRRSVDVAAPLAAVLSIVLPLIGQGQSSLDIGPWHPERPAALLASVAFLGLLAFARYCPEEESLSPLWARRLVIWLVPPLVAWIVISPSSTRYLAPAWPALLVLVAASLATAAAGAQLRRPVAGAAVLALVALIGVADLRNLDALGSHPDGSISAWRAVRELGVTGWFDRDRARRAADPALAGELAAVRAELPPDGRVLSTDGRLGFFWPHRLVHERLGGCDTARRADVFVLITSRLSALDADRRRALPKETRRELGTGQASGVPYWEACRDPRLTLTASQPDAFAVFRVERSR
jgi:hypothetical protein